MEKLMEYSMELYQAAKNMAAMLEHREREEYDSLWEEEGEEGPVEDPIEIADGAEVFTEGPAIVEAAYVLTPTKSLPDFHN